MNRSIERRLGKLEDKSKRGLKQVSDAELHAELRRAMDALGGPEAAFPLLVEFSGEEEAITTIRWYHAGPEELHWFGSLPPPGFRSGARPRDPLR